MNLLSALSIIIFTSFFIGAWHIMTAERKNILNRSGGAVLISLGWWSLCNSFFFAAATQEQAMRWHKLGSLGWCGFVVLTAYYFLALTNLNRKIIVWWKQVLFFAPAVVLICKNLFGKTTSLAQNIIPSTSGFGWTYENSAGSFWLWVYLLYVALYFGAAFYFLYQWAKTVKHRMKKEMAVKFIVLDLITILFGVVTDVVIPLTNPVIPALASIGTILFGAGYFGIIYRHDLFNINLVISSDDILQISNNAIFVVDEQQEILKYNHAAGSLLGYNKGELLGANFMRLETGNLNVNQLIADENLINVETKLHCKDDTMKDVLLSASIAKDKHHSFLCSIISCQDVSKQKKVQVELELAQQKYKKLAKEYQKLAYFDTLTGLPNRRQLFDVLGEFEKHYQTDRKDFAVFMLDLDHFKHANDVYGHVVGDELLKAAAQKLNACTKSDEFVARLGGDEFVILMPIAKAGDIDEKIQGIRTMFCSAVLFDEHFYELGVSVGYEVFSRIENIGQLIQKADEGMYRNKREKITHV